MFSLNVPKFCKTFARVENTSFQTLQSSRLPFVWRIILYVKLHLCLHNHKISNFTVTERKNVNKQINKPKMSQFFSLDLGSTKLADTQFISSPSLFSVFSNQRKRAINKINYLCKKISLEMVVECSNNQTTDCDVCSDEPVLGISVSWEVTNQ